MPLTCIAIDDEPLAIELISSYIKKIPGLQLVQTFDDAISGGEFLRNHRVDLLFVDINMPDITGIDLVKSLPDKPMIIFTTAYRNFALEGFELEAIDYLLKPISFDRFEKAIKKSISLHTLKQAAQPSGDAYLFVRSEYRMIKIETDDIVYIEGLEDYIKIHLATGKPVLTLMTLKTALEKLPADKFKRIHRSYIIPVKRVRSILNRKITLDTGVELPVSDSYAASVSEWQKRR